MCFFLVRRVARARGFLLVRGAILAMRHSAGASSDVPQCFAKLSPKSVWKKVKQCCRQRKAFSAAFISPFKCPVCYDNILWEMDNDVCNSIYHSVWLPFVIYIYSMAGLISCGTPCFYKSLERTGSNTCMYNLNSNLKPKYSASTQTSGQERFLDAIPGHNVPWFPP